MTDPGPPGLRAAIYARVSDEDQVEKYGLPAQLGELRAWAARRGLTVVGEYADEGVSGTLLARPALDRLREAMRSHAVDRVLMLDPDRLARKLLYQLLLQEEAEAAGIRLEYLTHPLDATPETSLLLQVRGVISEYERLKLLERTRRGRLAKARMGRMPNGRAAYGYRPVPADSGHREPDPATALVVQQIFAWAAASVSRCEIARRLRAQGILSPQGNQWTVNAVSRILTNPAYYGEAIAHRIERCGGRDRVRDRGEWISVPVPALVARELWDRVQGDGGRTRAGRPPVRVYLLRGLLRCGVCGRRCRGSATRGERGGTYRYYLCGSKDGLVGATPCGLPSLRAEDLEALVWSTLLGLLRQPGVLLSRLEAHRAQLGVREVEVLSEVEHLRRQLATLTGRVQRALDLLLDATLPQGELRARVATLTAERDRVAAQLRAAEARAVAQATAQAREGDLRVWCAAAEARLGQLSKAERAQALRLLLDSVVVEADQVTLVGVLPGLGDAPPVFGESSQPVCRTGPRSPSARTGS